MIYEIFMGISIFIVMVVLLLKSRQIIAYIRAYHHGQFIDDGGYLRYKKNKKLVHREVAFKKFMKIRNMNFIKQEIVIRLQNGGFNNFYAPNFSSLIVHHVDKNKLNNKPKNLWILTPSQHEVIHHD